MNGGELGVGRVSIGQGEYWARWVVGRVSGEQSWGWAA